ncbi:MAG: aldo/keto reductase [Myxococcota bacterium]
MDLSTWHDMRTRDRRRLTLGSAQWGMPYGIANHTGPPDEDELIAMLTRARAAGVGIIDTARAYGESELAIGRALRADQFGGAGEGFRVVTKLDPSVHSPGLDILETFDRANASLCRSREALGLDVLPTLLLHRFAHRHACGGKLWRLLLAERDAGRIGALGVSAASPEEAWAALEDPDVQVLQVASSLLDLRLHQQGFFPRARELGRTVYVRSVFLQGVAHLDPAALPAHLAPLAPAMQRIASFAQELGVPSRALYLGFARELLPGAYPVVGCEREAQLAELLEDWTNESVDAAALTSLVEALPLQEAEIVDPSKWPAGKTESELNRTARPSIAKLTT